MKLIMKEIEKKLPALYSQSEVADPTVHFKLFTPWTNWTWYITEGDLSKGLLFGLCCGMEAELGYVDLNELQSVRGPAGLRIERDLHFTPCKLSEVRRKYL